jgi:hypothetical protein
VLTGILSDTSVRFVDLREVMVSLSTVDEANHRRIRAEISMSVSGRSDNPVKSRWRFGEVWEGLVMEPVIGGVLQATDPPAR